MDEIGGGLILCAPFVSGFRPARRTRCLGACSLGLDDRVRMPARLGGHAVTGALHPVEPEPVPVAIGRGQARRLAR